MKSTNNLVRALNANDFEILDMVEIKGGSTPIVVPIQYKCNTCTQPKK